jgi:hypothetical protein
MKEQFESVAEQRRTLVSLIVSLAIRVEKRVKQRGSGKLR